MCIGVMYLHQSRLVRWYFVHPDASLPVYRRDHSIIQLPWGRRPDDKSQLPCGCCAKLEVIRTGHWDKWFPRPVRLPVCAFLFNDRSMRRQEWRDLTAAQNLQGLVAYNNHEQRVYIVTIRDENGFHIPRIIYS